MITWQIQANILKVIINQIKKHEKSIISPCLCSTKEGRPQLVLRMALSEGPPLGSDGFTNG